MAQERVVSFAHDVKPLLENRCLKCHGPAMKGAGKGAALVPGDPEKSPLYRHVAGLEKPQMPMDGKLKAEDAAVLRDWISQGAKWEGVLGAPGSGFGLSVIVINDPLAAGWRVWPAFLDRPDGEDLGRDDDSGGQPDATVGPGF